MKLHLKQSVIIISFLAVITAFLAFTYHFDNKYTAGTLLPQDGVLSLRETDMQANMPIFLIDEWQINDGLHSPSQWDPMSAHQTYIGEFSNFRQNNSLRGSLGAATYQLRLHYMGDPIAAALELPELFFNYQLWLDDTLLDEGSGTARANFTLTPGPHTLTVGTESNHGYYAGMYFPGSLGNPEAILRVERIRSFGYALAFLAPLVLALYSLFLWQITENRLRGLFALLCLSFSAYIFYYFVQLWNLPFAHHWYLVEDAALHIFFFFAVTLSMEAAGMMEYKGSRVLITFALAFPILETALYLLTPVWNGAAPLHSSLQDIYRVFIFLCLVLCTILIWKTENTEKRFILGAGAILGIGIISNLLFSNLFEPIYTFWQMEWCGLLLVVLFACLMVSQNKRIIAENTGYQNQLEQMVEERTQQLSCLLEERRAFFSDMAHDLKAPLFATNTFIQMIRRHSVKLDNELLYFIDQVEHKQEEMSRRVQSLNALNAVDKLDAPTQQIEVAELLDELYKTHNPEASVSGIHLVVQIPPEPLFIRAQREKLMVAFENLIYNAFRFTQSGGSITVSCVEQDGTVCFIIADNGCGISEAELPRVFDRFFVGEAGKSTGSGLGLYIVKSIAEEAGGTVSAHSVEGKGTSFSLRIPMESLSP